MANINQILTSTNFDPMYAMENIFPQYEVTYIDGTIKYVRDYLGADVIRLIKRIRVYSPYIFQGHEPFTTIVYSHYGTTTPTAIVLMYNGIMHPLELAPKSIIKLPDLSPLVEYVTRKGNINNLGKTITI